MSSQDTRSVGDDRDPIVVLAADDNFAMPLAVTVRSALDNLAPGRKLKLYVLDGGISNTTKDRLLGSWPEGRYHITWLSVDASTLSGLPISGHVNLVSYYRILIPALLPNDLRRVIYLDSDLIVFADLARLWDQDLAGHLCLAVQDCAAPYIDSSAALANYRHCAQYLGSPQPVPNFRELGLSPQAAYFNAGVLLIDLDAWRDADLSRHMLECLEQHKQHVLWWDQYALNVVLAGRWGSLDARWNQGSQVFMYPTPARSPYDQTTYQQLRTNPYIVHFTTRYKPWLPSCRHPFRKQFFEYVDCTAWSGWRPSRLGRLSAILEIAKSQERRLRHGRKKIRRSVAEWFQK